MKIKALRAFSHYTAGNFSQGDTRVVTKEIADALIGLRLAESVDDTKAASPEPKPAKSGGKSGNKRRTTDPDKDAPES